MSPEQGRFLSLLNNLYSLPRTTETADHRICFNDKLPISRCTPNPIESVIGTTILYTDEGAAQPTLFQCYKFLTANWPYITNTFNKLFPEFTGPDNLDSMTLNNVKFFLYSIILEIGYAEMNKWTDLKAAWNAPGVNWKNYIAWMSATPGYSLDGGLTKKEFPSLYLARLITNCGSNYCFELENLFYIRSTVCNNAACSDTVQGYCLHVRSASPCATRVG